MPETFSYRDHLAQLEDRLAEGDERHQGWQIERQHLVKTIEGLRPLVQFENAPKAILGSPARRVYPEGEFRTMSYTKIVRTVLAEATRPMTVPEIADMVTAAGKDIRQRVKSNLDSAVKHLRKAEEVAGEASGLHLTAKGREAVSRAS